MLFLPSEIGTRVVLDVLSLEIPKMYAYQKGYPFGKGSFYAVVGITKNDALDGNCFHFTILEIFGFFPSLTAVPQGKIHSNGN